MRLGCEKHVLGSLDYFRQSPLRTKKWRKSSIVSNRYFWLLLIRRLVIFGVLEDQARTIATVRTRMLKGADANLKDIFAYFRKNFF